MLPANMFNQVPREPLVIGLLALKADGDELPKEIVHLFHRRKHDVVYHGEGGHQLGARARRQDRLVR